MSNVRSVTANLYRVLAGAALGVFALALMVFIDGASVWPIFGQTSDDLVQQFVEKQVPHGAQTTYNLRQPQRDLYSADAEESGRYGQTTLVSPALSHAAQEVALFYRQTRRLAPSKVLSSFLNAGGAPYWGVHQTVLVTTLQGDGPIIEILNDALAQFQGRPHVGLGEVIVQEHPRLRIITLLLAKKTFDFHALKTNLSANQNARITGRLETGYTTPHILAMSPDGRIESIPVHTEAGGFEFSIQTSPGLWTVEVIATGPVGPIPLAQIELVVSTAPPNQIVYTWPRDEAAIKSPSAYLTKLVNQARAKAGLKRLERVRTLDWVAWQHSEDMRTHDYVGHFSPRTGMLTQRLDRVAYERATAGENVALNSTLADAHQGLMHSLGHRKNLLSGDYTELGIGVRRGPIGWYITQVFSGGGPRSRLGQTKHARLSFEAK